MRMGAMSGVAVKLRESSGVTGGECNGTHSRCLFSIFGSGFCERRTSSHDASVSWLDLYRPCRILYMSKPMVDAERRKKEAQRKEERESLLAHEGQVVSRSLWHTGVAFEVLRHF